MTSTTTPNAPTDARVPALPDLSDCRRLGDELEAAPPLPDVVVRADDGDLSVLYAFEGDDHEWDAETTVDGVAARFSGWLAWDGSSCDVTSVSRGDEDLDEDDEDELLAWAEEHLAARVTQLWLGLDEEQRLAPQLGSARESTRHYACELWRAQNTRRPPVPVDYLAEQLRLAHTRQTALLLTGAAGVVARHLTRGDHAYTPQEMLAAVDAATSPTA